MPVRFKIFVDQNLIYIRYTGRVQVSDSIAAVKSYRLHPDFSPKHKYLVDMAGITELVPEPAETMKFMASLPEMFETNGNDLLNALYAPNPIGREMADVVLKTWSGVPHMIVRVFDELPQCFDFLGITVQVDALQKV